MKRPGWTMLAAGVLGLISACPGHAQGPYVRPQMNNPYYRPPISPYLGLGLSGNPAINYYNVVRPQLGYNASIQQLQQFQNQEAAELSALSGTGINSGLPITGVRSQFMNFSHYYGGRVAGPANLPPAVMPPAVLPPAIIPPLNAVTATTGR